MVGDWPGGHFNPHRSLNRAETTAILFRMENGGGWSPPSATTHFWDVIPGSGSYWARDYIAWVASRGIVQGVGGGRFAPNESLTREQLAAMMYRFAVSRGYSVLVPPQVSAPPGTSNWAREYMRWARHNGFTGEGNPQFPATRAETAFFIHQFDHLYNR